MLCIDKCLKTKNCVIGGFVSVGGEGGVLHPGYGVCCAPGAGQTCG